MKQAEKTYLISDAAKQVTVEAHVLRYWEEELALPIKRNELGHRYYTEEDISRFKEIRDLKERGLQLKAIRSLLTRADGDIVRSTQEKNMMMAGEGIKRHVLMVNKGEFLPVQEESREAKSLRLQQLLQTMIAEAVKSSNREVCEEIKESLLKELDYQFRIQEEREEERELVRMDRQEEHYRKIDELIRARNPKKVGLERRTEKKNLSSEECAGQAKRLQELVKDKQVQKEEKMGGEKKIGFLRKKRSIV